MKISGSRLAVGFGLQAAIAVMALGMPVAARADAPDWSQVTSAPAPSSIIGAGAYDSALGETLYFGGIDFSTSLLSNDLYTFDGTSWSLAPTGADKPAPREFGEMAYDSDRNRLVVFGGFDSVEALGDTWEWDGSTWTEVATTGPAARYDAAMVYDSAHHRTLLYGGTNSTNVALGDTWAWDGTTWTQLTPNAEPARFLSSLAFDSARGVAVLFGGYDLLGNEPNDTWEFDGSAWKQTAVSGPSGRAGAGLAFDAALSRTVLFGSDTGDTGTYEWDGTGWTQLPTTTTPPATYLSPMTFDSKRGVLDLVVGYDLTTGATDAQTWTFGSASAPQPTPTPRPAPDPQPVATSLTVADATATYGGQATLSAVARDDSGNAVPGSVTFTVGKLTASGSTDAYGSVTASLGLGNLATGTYDVSASFAPASNGFKSATGAAHLTINPAPLTVSVNSVAKVYGAPNPAFTATFNGLVAGDTAASLGTLSFATTATQASPVGSYPVTASGLNAPNYTVTYNAGTLTVTKEGVTLTPGGSLTALSGRPVLLTVLVAGPAGNLPVNEGTVTITDEKGQVVCSGVAVVAGHASCTTARPLSIGTHTFTIAYSGTANVAYATATWTVTVVNHDK